MRPLRISLIVLLALFAGLASAGETDTVNVRARIYRLTTAVDVSKIKAIGSSETKRPPSILQVDKVEADRVADLVVKNGAKLMGTPTVLTKMGEKAKVEVSGDGDGYVLEVTPSSKGSDTITLRFRYSVTTVDGSHRITRSAGAFARVEEAKSLLVIENPRDGQPGLLVILEARRQK